MNVERLGDGFRDEVSIGLGLGSGSVLGYSAGSLGPKRDPDRIACPLCIVAWRGGCMDL